jgi:hypothetical protein
MGLGIRFFFFRRSSVKCFLPSCFCSIYSKMSVDCVLLYHLQQNRLETRSGLGREGNTGSPNRSIETPVYRSNRISKDTNTTRSIRYYTYNARSCCAPNNNGRCITANDTHFLNQVVWSSFSFQLIIISTTSPVRTPQCIVFLLEDCKVEYLAIQGSCTINRSNRDTKSKSQSE